MQWTECLGVAQPHPTLYRNYYNKYQLSKLSCMRVACYEKLLQQGLRLFELKNLKVDRNNQISCGCEYYRRKSWKKAKAYEPCHCPGKHPARSKKTRMIHTSLESLRGVVRKYSTANWGIDLGADAGFWVLDIDVRNGGLESLRQLEELIGPLPPTLKVITGGVAKDIPGVPDGARGFHLYFKHPGHGFKISRWLGEKWPGLDIKGDGGHTVAPLSFHVSGHFYYMEDGPLEVAEAPPVLLEMVCEDLSKPKKKASHTCSDSALEMTDEQLEEFKAEQQRRIAMDASLAKRAERYNDVAVQRECAKVAQAAHGDGYSSKCASAFKLGQLVSGNLLDFTYARDSLFAASEQRGGKLRFDVINQCLVNGTKTPRSMPESQNTFTPRSSSLNPGCDVGCSHHASEVHEEAVDSQFPRNRCARCFGSHGPCQSCFEQYVGTNPDARQYPGSFYCTRGRRWLGQHREKPHLFIDATGRCNRWKCGICGAAKAFEYLSHLQPAFARINQGITLKFNRDIEQPPAEEPCHPEVFRMLIPMQYAKGYNQKLANLGFVKSVKILTFHYHFVIYCVIPPDADPRKLEYHPRQELRRDGSCVVDSSSKPVFTPTRLTPEDAWTEIVKHVNHLGVFVKLNLPPELMLRSFAEIDSPVKKRGLSGVSLRGGWQIPERLKKAKKFKYRGQIRRDATEVVDYILRNKGEISELRINKIDRSELLGMPSILMEMHMIEFNTSLTHEELETHIAWLLHVEEPEVWPIQPLASHEPPLIARKLCDIQPILFK